MERKSKALYILFPISTSIMGCCVVGFLIFMGYYRDASGFVPNSVLYNWGPFILLAFLAALFLLFTMGTHFKWKWPLRKTSWGLLGIALLAVIYQGVAVHNLSYYSNIGEVPLERLRASAVWNNVFYIGRDSCGDCNEFFPVLARLSHESDVTVLYYNTEQDRNSRYDEMMEVLQWHGVSSVPTLLVYKEGQLSEKFEGDTISVDTQKYFWELKNPQ